MPQFDILFTRGRYFDGTAINSYTADVAIKDGKIAKVSRVPIDPTDSLETVDASNKWITPGFIDSHTHYDAELLVAPSLSESVRHGVTTVLVGSCSLSMVCSRPLDASDIFTRVETVPREKVLPILQQQKTWNNAKDWVNHINSLPLGPNVVSLLGHSDLRASVMGLERSTDANVKPNEDELTKMETILKESLEAGFLGLSTMSLTWDKVDGDRAWSKSLPSTYAPWSEINRLSRIVRKYNRVLQGAPNAAKPLQIFEYIKESLGWFRRPLKTTLISQMDLKGSAYLTNLTKLASRIANFFRGDFRWQVLPTPFTVYADGIDVVFFEEFGAGEMALDLKDQIERNKLLKDESYRRNFREYYGEKLSPRVWQRDFGDAIIETCPDESLVGKNFAEIAKERNIHVVDLFLDLVVEFGKQLRWYTTIGNHRPMVLKKLISESRSLITFSDAGAHIRNMAFYNLPLRLLKTVYDDQKSNKPCMTIEQAVYKVTGDQANWLGIDAGMIREGDRADLVVIDPQGFNQNLEQVSWAEMEGFDLKRLVNRNPGIVEQVVINGQFAVKDQELTSELGQSTKLGQFLAAR